MRETDDHFGPLYPPPYEPPVIDGRARRVGGQLAPGDPHPTRRGWLYTGVYDNDGNVLWFKPTPRWQRVIFVTMLTAVLGFAITLVVCTSTGAFGPEGRQVTFQAWMFLAYVVWLFWRYGPRPPVPFRDPGAGRFAGRGAALPMPRQPPLEAGGLTLGRRLRSRV